MHSFGGNPDGSEAFEDPELDTVAAMLEDDPSQIYLRRRYGLLLFRRRRFKDAATQFSQWAREAPGDRESFLFLSRALLRLRMYDFARAAAEMASESEALLPSVSRTLHRISEMEGAATAFDTTPRDLDEQVESYDEDTVDLEPSAPEDGVIETDENIDDFVPVFEASDGSLAPPRTPTPPHLDWRDRLVKSVDESMRFIALIKSLILRNISFTLQNKPASLFMIGGRMLIVINFHVMFFYATGRHFAGQIALLTGTLAPFLNWNCFKQVESRTDQRSADRSYNLANNIKWVHLYVADCVWDLIRILICSTIIVAFGDMYLSAAYVQPMVPQNIPRILAMVGLTSCLGAGLGMCIEGLQTRWPMFLAIHHLLTWIMYVTCGVYESYITLPSFLSPYFKLNPLLTITEYCRQGFDASYPVGDLTLWYPITLAGTLIVLGLALRAKASADWHHLQHA